MTPQKKTKQEVYKAAEVCSEYQDACNDFFTSKTHDNAEKLIRKCDELLDVQNVAGTQFVNADSVRHRKLTAEAYIENNPKTTKAASSDGNGAWEYYTDKYGRRIQKFK